jgi:integrase
MAAQHKTQARRRSARNDAVKAYLRSSLSPNTTAAYASDLARFKRWGGRIPASAEQVARYLATAATTLRPSTLTRQVAAIAFAHANRNFESPTKSPLVKRTLRGIRRTHGTAPRQARPLTTELLRIVCKPLSSCTKLQNLRDRALFLIGFSGGFRRSELASLRVGDLDIGGSGVVVKLRSSKTDQYARGRDVAIPFASTASHCPVRALNAWLNAMRDALTLATLPATLPLFARIDKHSLRAGLVTSAAKAGVPVWAIQRQTGHKSDLTVHRYIRNLDAFECNAASSLL